MRRFSWHFLAAACVLCFAVHYGLQALLLAGQHDPVSSCAAVPIDFVLALEDKEDFPQWIGNTVEVDTVRPGVAVEFFRRVCENVGVNPRFCRFPWKRCLEIELPKGAVDGVIRVRYRKERERLGVYPMESGAIDSSRRYITRAFYFYRRKGSGFCWDGRKITGLEGKIGFNYGYAVADDLARAGAPMEPGMQVEYDMKNLSNGKLGAVLAFESAGDHVIKNYPDIEKVNPSFMTVDLYLILSHQFVEKYPALAEKTWNAVRKFRESELPGLLEKYGE